MFFIQNIITPYLQYRNKEMSNYKDDYLMMIRSVKTHDFYSNTIDDINSHFEIVENKYHEISSNLFQEIYNRLSNLNFNETPTYDEILCCEDYIGYLCWQYFTYQDITTDYMDDNIKKYMLISETQAYKDILRNMIHPYTYNLYYGYIK